MSITKKNRDLTNPVVCQRTKKLKKMKYTFLILFFIFLIACGDSPRSPEVVYPENSVDSTDTSTTILEPIGKNLFMGFPFAFDSTSLYIHTVKNTYDLNGNDNYKLRSGSDSYDYGYDNNPRYRGTDEISGWFYNFLFQEAISETLRPITNKDFRFSRMEIIRDTINKQAIHTLLLNVYDKDSNRDKFLNRNDLLSYYVADVTGKDLRKISPKGHLPQRYSYDKRLKRLYFSTIEDTNKNGKFENNDPRHQYYYSIETGKVVEVKLPF